VLSSRPFELLLTQMTPDTPMVFCFIPFNPLYAHEGSGNVCDDYFNFRSEWVDQREGLVELPNEPNFRRGEGRVLGGAD